MSTAVEEELLSSCCCWLFPPWPRKAVCVCVYGWCKNLSISSRAHRPFYIYERSHPSYMYDHVILLTCIPPPPFPPAARLLGGLRRVELHPIRGQELLEEGEGEGPPFQRLAVGTQAILYRFCMCMYLWVSGLLLNESSWGPTKASSSHQSNPITKSHPHTHTYIPPPTPAAACAACGAPRGSRRGPHARPGTSTASRSARAARRRRSPFLWMWVIRGLGWWVTLGFYFVH